MIVIYAVYLDTYFVENLLLDISVLILTTLLWDKPLRWKRILVAAFTGAFLSSGILLLKLQGYPIDGVGRLLFGIVVLKLAYPKNTTQELLRGALYFYTISFVFTKLYGMLRECIGEIHGMAICILGLLIICIAITYIKYHLRKEKEDVYYDVEILSKGKKIRMRALHDTGNTLTEPVSGRQVSIVEKSIMEEVWKMEAPERYKYIPYHSVGKEHGMLIGMEVDGIMITKGERRVERYNEIVALYDGKLSGGGGFEMILHRGIL